jgi:hypothetical protein
VSHDTEGVLHVASRIGVNAAFVHPGGAPAEASIVRPGDGGDVVVIAVGGFRHDAFADVAAEHLVPDDHRRRQDLVRFADGLLRAGIHLFFQTCATGHHQRR